MDATIRFDTNVVGAMPVIVSYFDRLGLRDVINELVPWQGEVPLGDLIEILILNRLLNSKAMFKIGDWTAKASVDEFYGLSATDLNDDRLGRALERIAEHGDAVQTGLVLNAIEEFDLKVSQIHYDVTSVELYGAYDSVEQEHSAPRLPRPNMVAPRAAAKTSSNFNRGSVSVVMVACRYVISRLTATLLNPKRTSLL